MPAQPKATLEQLLKHLGFEAEVTEHPFDDFAASGVDRAAIRKLLGLSEERA